jgi:hypothetical protein
MYILVVRHNVDGNNSLVRNLGVYRTLQSAITFVIKQRITKSEYFWNGILKFQTADAIDAYG